MSQHPRQMQKTIPQTPHQQIEIQTDLNLIGRQLIASEIIANRVPLRLADFISESGLLQPFSDYYLYSQLEDVVSRMRKDVEQEKDESKQERLIQYLSNQINGLMRRQLRIDGHKGTYYSILGDKDREILNMEIRYSAFESKLRKSNEKIFELQNQIMRLRHSLKQLQNASQENVIYRQCFSQLSVMLGENRKVTDIQSFINSKVSPLIKQTQLRLGDIAKNASRDRRNKVKGVLAEYSKELNTFYLDQSLTLQSLSESVAAFYTNLQHINDDNWIQQRIRISGEYENLRNHQQSLISILNKNIDQILLENPSFKSLKEFKQFTKIIDGQQRNGVQTMIVNGWVSVGKVDGRVVQVPVQDARTKQVISILGIEMKKLLTKYPQIKSQLSGNLLEFLSLQILEDTVGVDALDRLKEIVVYRSDLLKVQNVYNYSSKEDKDLIFHLRVLIKSLLQELQAMRSKYDATINLDEGIIGLLNQQVLQGIDVSAILGLYRPQPKVVQVEKIVDRPVYIMDQLQHGVPIRTEKGIYGEKMYEKPVVIEKSVPFEMQKPIIDTVKEFVQVKTINEVPVSIPTVVQKLVERVVVEEKIIEVPTEKPVPCKEQVKEIIQSEVQKIVKEQQVIEKQVPVQLWRETIKEIQKFTDKPVYLYKQSQRAVEIPVLKEYCHPKPVYVEIEKKIPYQVRTHEIKELIREVPKIIMESTEIIKPVPEIQEKIVQVNVEKDPEIIEVPINVERQLIREIEKEVFVEMTHFVKGDREQIIKEVEVFVDRPIIHEVIVSKDVEIEKVTPLYIRQQKPVYVDVKVPFYKPEIKPVDLVVEKPVFLKEQIIKQIRVQVPVPIIIEKQVVKVTQCVREKIIEKIVQVPRVQVVEKIVEKVVVVPRIIEKIVQVPQIIEKCVVIERPILQVAEIPRQIAVVRTVEVPQVVEMSKEVLVENPTYKEVQVQIPVEKVIEREVAIQIEVQRRIPQEIIKQIPQDIFRDKVVEKIIEINEVQVKDREVQIPIVVQQAIPIVQQKAVLHQKVVENIIKVPQIIEKLVPAEKIIEKEVRVEVKEEVCVEKEVVVEIPGETIIQYEKQFVDVELIQEKIVEVKVIEEVPREVFLQVEKIIPLTMQKIVNVPQIRYLAKPQLIEVSHPVHHINYKEVPLVVESTRHIPTRTILQQIKEIQVEVEKTVSVTVQREKILKCVENIKQWCTKEVPKDVVQEVVLRESPEIQVREIEVEKLIEPLKNKIIQIQQSEKSFEKVVQKIVMLPQIVEVVKTIHEISQVQAVGVAKDVEAQVHTKEYIGLTKDLRGEIAALLASFKSKVRNQPDLKILIDGMQKYLLTLDKWIKFPKIIEVAKEVQVVVEKDRPVLIPTRDTDKEVALMAIIEQLISGIRKFRKEEIKQNLNEDMLNIFFMDFDLELTDVALENKYAQYIIGMREKYQGFGNWADNHALLLNSFLQSRFSMTNIIDEASRANRQNRSRIVELEKQLDQVTVCNMINEFAKEKTANDYAALVKSLMSLSTNYEFLESIITTHASILSPQEYFNQSERSSGVRVSQSYQYQVTHSIESEKPSSELNSLIIEKDREISSIIVRLSTAEQQRFENERVRGQLQRENDNLKYDLQIMRERLEGDASKSVTNIQQIQTRINLDWERRIQNLQENYERQTQRLRSQIKSQLSEGSSNNELLNENRKLSDEVRVVKRQYDNYKRTQESLKQNFESQKKRITDEFENKIKSISQSHERERKRELENVKKSSQSSNQNLELEKERLKEKYERQMRMLKEDLEKAKSSSSTVKRQVSSDQNLQIRKLKDHIRKIEIELDTSKRQIQAYQKSKLGQTTYTSGYKQSIVEEYQSPRHDPYRSAVEGERYQYKSPESEEGSLQGSRLSRESRQSRKLQGEEIQSSSSRVSGRSSGSQMGFKSSMTMKELMDVNSEEKSNICTLVMIKIIERIEEEANRGIVNCYTPSNIYLSNFNPSNIDSLVVRFGAPITNKKGKYDGLYIAPEVQRGEVINIKSVVFSLGVIWDELIHSQIYYKTISEIENLSHEFKVRDTKLNPILKNTLFEMMSKDAEKRLELNEVKRRLSLQKYITSETGGKVVVTSSRVSEQTKKP